MLRNTSDTAIKSVSTIDTRSREESLWAANVEGSPQAIALSAWTIAVAVDDSIQLFSTMTGARRGTIELHTKIDQLSMFGHTIVCATGRTIYEIDTRTHTLSALATAGQKPLGLSIDGTRVIWAEDSAGRARIKSVQLSQTTTRSRSPTAG